MCVCVCARARARAFCCCIFFGGEPARCTSLSFLSSPVPPCPCIHFLPQCVSWFIIHDTAAHSQGTSSPKPSSSRRSLHAWPPHGWVTVTCWTLLTCRDFSRVKFSPDSTNVHRIRLQSEVPPVLYRVPPVLLPSPECICIYNYKHEKIPQTPSNDHVVYATMR